jgi:hypothetical protein
VGFAAGSACKNVTFDLAKSYIVSACLSLSEIKSEHVDGAIHQELVWAECVRRPDQPTVRTTAKAGTMPTGDRLGLDNQQSTQKWPARRHVGTDGDKPEIVNLHLTTEFKKPFSLSAVPGAEIAPAEDENNWMLSLKFGELAAFGGVVAKLIVGEDSLWNHSDRI